MSYKDERIAQIKAERKGAYRLEGHSAWLRKNPHDKLARLRQSQGLPEPNRSEPANCECCGRRKRGKALSLDHCHTSGHFRGWLCDKCNLGIGLLGDDMEALERALLYLRAAECDIPAIEAREKADSQSQGIHS